MTGRRDRRPVHAYPNGRPVTIGASGHIYPVEGDNGIQFLPREGMSEQCWNAIEAEFNVSRNDSFDPYRPAGMAGGGQTSDKFSESSENKLYAKSGEEIAAIRALANQGDPQAQNDLGDALRDSGEYEEAAQWYLKAALQENPDSQVALGLLFQDGTGVLKIMCKPLPGSGKLLKGGTH